MIQNRLNDKEKDIQGLKKQSALLLNSAWEKGYAAGFDDGYKTGRQEDERLTGEWEIVDAEVGKIWNCVCTECGHDPQEYIGGTENWWLRKSHLPNFCPNCGALIVNVKGGETDEQ